MYLRTTRAEGALGPNPSLCLAAQQDDPGAQRTPDTPPQRQQSRYPPPRASRPNHVCTIDYGPVVRVRRRLISDPTVACRLPGRCRGARVFALIAPSAIRVRHVSKRSAGLWSVPRNAAGLYRTTSRCITQIAQPRDLNFIFRTMSALFSSQVNWHRRALNTAHRTSAGEGEPARLWRIVAPIWSSYPVHMGSGSDELKFMNFWLPFTRGDMSHNPLDVLRVRVVALRHVLSRRTSFLGFHSSWYESLIVDNGRIHPYLFECVCVVSC